MKRIKIVHTGDLHFDTPFKDVGESQSRINKEELKEVFRNIIHFCKEKAVDILLLTGDIFDNFTLNRETLYFIEQSLKEILEVKVFISPGNHDPYGNKSFYKLINWPHNVYIFKGDLEKVYLEDLDINVWGYGFREKYIRESVLKDFSEPSDKINIMVLHGEISSSNKGNEYNPITFDDIRNSGMDYIALGHRHNFSGINKEGQTFYAYSGCPQGRGFGELGDKGIIYGYVSKGTVDLEFVKTSKRNYIEEHIDISDSFGYEEVKKSIIDSINESDRKHNLYKIVLEGEISPDFSIDEELLRERLGLDFYYCKIVDKTRVKYNIEEITKGYSVKSLFVKKIMNLIDSAETEEDEEVLMMALKVGLSSLSEGQVNMNDY
ncbi:MAG: DNA repair exonuclease [Clostridium sp.]|uniref:metallophosphoesterase family protein n=1 Tax=Clostridium sp. TaxID=1506 RepID=UPI0029100226|nr:DNA repair exonuclease [Clostridium sp.]MDU4939780.1 DNA repair exonuclease [Clostridium sp.]